MRRTFTERLEWLETMKQWSDNWNSYGSHAIVHVEIERAKAWLTQFQEQIGDIDPDFITGAGEGGVCFEWRNGEKQIIVYIEGDIEYILLYGLNTKEGDAKFPSFVQVWNLFNERIT